MVSWLTTEQHTYSTNSFNNEQCTSRSRYVHSGNSQWSPHSPTESTITDLANNQFRGHS